MAKYSFELKHMVAMEYINGQGGYRYLAKSMAYHQEPQLRIGSQNTIIWVKMVSKGADIIKFTLPNSCFM